MDNNHPSRRDLSLEFAALLAAFAAIRAAKSAAAALPETPGLLSDAEAIHQEVLFAAPRHRVYDALTTAEQFDAVSKLGAAARGGKLPSAPTKIAEDPGGSFVLFGGYIVGRQLELVPDIRLVQAWREESWVAGVFSIVKFEFFDDGTGTKLVFDHMGFPRGAGKHLSIGWYQDYWNPLKEYLSRATVRE